MKEAKFSKRQIDCFNALGIHTIYLFGSHSRGYVHALSDIDIGIVFENPEKYKNKTMRVYLKLYDICTDIYPKAKQIDIVFLQLTPMDLQMNAIQHGKILYEKSKKQRLNYEEYVMKRFADLKYLYDLQYKAIIERI